MLRRFGAASSLARRALRPATAMPPRRGLSSTPPGDSSSDGSGSGSGKGLLDRVQSPETQKGAAAMNEKLASGVGWREALSTGMYEQNKAKRDQMVVDRLEKLANMPVFSFNEQEEEFQTALDEMENGITRFQKAQLFADRMQGGTISQSIDKRKEDTKMRLSIIGEFNEHERRNMKLLDWKARRDIARKLGIEVKWVDDVIFQFHLQYAQWAFLRREKLRGRPIPTTSDELEVRLRGKPTREFIEVMQLFQRKKKELEEAHPSYVKPPRDMHIDSARRPLKIRPYISSSWRNPERRKPPPKPDKRMRGPFLVQTGTDRRESKYVK